MFELNDTVASNSSSNLEDTANLKMALSALGKYDDSETGLSPYGDQKLFDAIKSLQQDESLKVDGIIKPNGPTHTKIREKLQKDTKSGNAFMDFKRNYFDMRKANTIGADKYFHCKANYEASEKGHEAEKRAEQLSNLRVKYKKNIKNDSNKDIFEDQGANIYGREAAKTGRFKSAKEACAIFRPNGLDEKY